MTDTHPEIGAALAALDHLIADGITAGHLTETGDPERPYALTMMPRVWLSAYDFGRVCVETADGTSPIDALAEIVTERAAVAAGLI